MFSHTPQKNANFKKISINYFRKKIAHVFYPSVPRTLTLHPIHPFNYTPICHTHTRAASALPRSEHATWKAPTAVGLCGHCHGQTVISPHSHLARALVLRTHASQLTCPLRLIFAFPPPPPAAQRRFRFAIRPSRHPLPLRPCRQQTAPGTYGWTVGGGLRWDFLRPPLHLRRPFPRRLWPPPA